MNANMLFTPLQGSEAVHETVAVFLFARARIVESIGQWFSTLSDRGPVNSFFYKTRAQYN
jgi:hypothetical protein